ncbi:hypothetical protein BDZ97DRAFT_2059312 [Flammula alnicola]|nr:hypothetical protein BDZ97DRAFT_2059312 [Flammula alnicola]
MALAITDHPDFSRLLENNEAPLKGTIDQVNELLEEPTQRLRHLAALIRELKEKEQAIQATINLYNRILSPARRVPPEIWSEIFYHCLPTQHNPIMSTSDSPLLLTRVCSTWRSAALSSPRLWARLHIPFACDTQENQRQDFAQEMKHRSEGVKYWLSRSGTCPISLSILYTSYKSTPSTSQYQWEAQISLGIFNAILPFASRWNDLELRMPSDIYQKLNAMVSVDMVPMLRCLRASFHDRDPRGYRYAANSFVLARAPNLRKISFNAPQLSTIFMEYNLALTYLCLHSLITYKDAFMLLDKCPNLIHCKLAVDATQGEVFEPPTLSKAFCDSINAPDLNWVNYEQHCVYQRTREVTQIPLPVLSLIERSNSITKLTFDLVGLSTRDISQCLQRAPLIRHLVIGPEPHGPSRTLPRHRPGMILTILDLNLLMVKAAREETLLPNLEVFEVSLTTDIGPGDFTEWNRCSEMFQDGVQ